MVEAVTPVRLDAVTIPVVASSIAFNAVAVIEAASVIVYGTSAGSVNVAVSVTNNCVA